MIVNGDASYGFMAAGADHVAKAIPGAQRMTLKGCGHDVPPDALAPVLRKLFSG